MLKINAPEGQATFGAPGVDGVQGHVSSAFAREAIDKGAELFDWRERVQRSGRRDGPRVTGVGVALSTFAAGASGVDGLFVIRPDGRIAIQSGVGNLGTGSTFDMMRPIAEGMDVPWEKCDVAWGDTSRHLPWSSLQAGSSTAHAHTRASWAAVLDARQKVREIAARDLGGVPEDYSIGGERVFRTGNRSVGLSFARVAQRAIDIGGRYDGHDLPEDINGMTTAAATALAGQGPDGGRPRQLRGGRAADVVRGRVRRGRGGRGDRRHPARRLRGGVRRRHHHPSPDVRGAGLRRGHPGLLGHPQPELGVRPALGAAGGQALLQQPPAGHPRRPRTSSP